MSYIKTNWKTGDIVTADKLNNIEAGVENSQEKISETNKISSDHVTEGTTNKFVSATDKTNWNAKSTVAVSEEGTATEEVKYITIDGVQKKLAGSEGEGKNWSTLDLDAADVIRLASGGQIVKNFTESYDATNFKNDYVLVNVEQTGVNGGTPIWTGEQINRVYVGCGEFVHVLTYLGSTLVDRLAQEGFEHNYYKTLILYAGCSDASRPILSGDNVIDGKNVVYVQDVSQQYWEYNTEVEKGEKAITRERSEQEVYGTALCFSLRGAYATEDIGFIFCLQDSQAAYWDSTMGATRWADMEAGKFYKVTFDTEHDTQRWLVNPVTTPGSENITAEELSDADISRLLNSGITFETPRYCAEAVEDTAAKQVGKCIASHEEFFTRIFSINSPFKEAESMYLQYIGRPKDYSLEVLTYSDGEKTHVKRGGEYIWSSDVDGYEVLMIVPDDRDEQGQPHRMTGIIQFNRSKLESKPSIYRHTFTVTPETNITWEEGQYQAFISFMAVNTQAGDSSAEYLLHSDEYGQDADWILPVSGTIGKVENVEGTLKVAKWYQAIRAVAGWIEIENNWYRCIYINYFDETTQELVKVPLITDLNSKYHIVRDYRTLIVTVKSPDTGVYLK